MTAAREPGKRPLPADPMGQPAEAGDVDQATHEALLQVLRERRWRVPVIPHPRSRRILLAEDDAAMRGLLAGTLLRDGYHVIEARDGLEALELLASAALVYGPPGVDLILCDVRMPHLDGFTFLDGLGRASWRAPVVLITAFGDTATHLKAERLGAVAIFDKPFDLSDLLAFARILLAGEHSPAPRA